MSTTTTTTTRPRVRWYQTNTNPNQLPHGSYWSPTAMTPAVKQSLGKVKRGRMRRDGWLTASGYGGLPWASRRPSGQGTVTVLGRGQIIG